MKKFILILFIFVIAIILTLFFLFQIKYRSWKTFNTDCGFNFKYPSKWSVQKTYEVCSFAILAPNASDYQGLNEKGTILTISRQAKGDHLYNPGPQPNQEIYYVFNTVDDSMKFYTDLQNGWTGKISHSNPTVSEPQGKSYGKLSGKYVLVKDPSGFTNEHFVAEYGDYLYNLGIIWHAYNQDKEKYSNVINDIFSSINFNN